MPRLSDRQRQKVDELRNHYAAQDVGAFVLITRDLKSIQPMEPHYPYGNQWNAYNPVPCGKTHPGHHKAFRRIAVVVNDASQDIPKLDSPTFGRSFQRDQTALVDALVRSPLIVIGDVRSQHTVQMLFIHDRRAPSIIAQLELLAVQFGVSPAGILLGEPQDQCFELSRDGRPATRSSLCERPFATDELTMSFQERPGLKMSATWSKRLRALLPTSVSLAARTANASFSQREIDGG